jgi:hypothetical protein
MTQIIHRIADSLNSLCGADVQQVLETRRKYGAPEIRLKQTMWKKLSIMHDIMSDLEKNFSPENQKWQTKERITLVKALVHTLVNSNYLASESVDIILPPRNSRDKAISFNDIPMEDFISFLVNVLRIRLRSKGYTKMPKFYFPEEANPSEKLLITFEELAKEYFIS